MNARVAPDPVGPWRRAYDQVPAFDAVSAARRAQAFAHFARLGFPAVGDEDWKYTSLRRLATREFAPAPREASLAAATHPAPSFGPHRVVLSNGYFNARASELGGLPPGLRVRPLGPGDSDAQVDRATLPTGGGTERFAALNVALGVDALLIEADAAVRADTVLQLQLDATGDGAIASHPRVLVRLAPDAGLRLVVHHRGDARAERFVNTVIDLDLGAGSELHLYRLQQQGETSFHVERIDAALASGARLQVHDASLGAALARLDLRVRLTGAGAAAELAGLFLADGTRHLDTQARIEHVAGGTQSLQDFRGIAAGRGRGVLNSRVVVAALAQKSKSRQTSRNLLLTPGAEIDTKPELEIHADDVQCNHGATTGQLDPQALFYLRSRGFDEQAARNALTRAFAASVLSRIDLEPFAAAVQTEFDTRLDRLLVAHT